MKENFVSAGGIDPDGVALAGVTARDDRTTTRQTRIDALEMENAELRQRLDPIELLSEQSRNSEAASRSTKPH